MSEFDPTPFEPHRWWRGGHLQTLVGVRSGAPIKLAPQRHAVDVSDNDVIVLHEDRPDSWRSGDPCMLLVHGLSGCHAAPYMMRLADQFLGMGMRVFRMDMRGCGAASGLCQQVTHAGRSEDIIAALGFIAELSLDGPLYVSAISMGGNQTLRGLGRIGGGHDPTPEWFSRLQSAAVVAPPIDLARCSRNMNRLRMRPYNYYFIRSLLSRVPQRVADREDYQQQRRKGRPKTLWQLDDQITAPLSGFRDAEEYYHESSAARVIEHVPVPTLVLVAEDDPLVPIGCFVDPSAQWSSEVELLIAKNGGHVGFIDRQRRCWMDHVLLRWFQHRESS